MPLAMTVNCNLQVSQMITVLSGIEWEDVEAL